MGTRILRIAALAAVLAVPVGVSLASGHEHSGYGGTPPAGGGGGGAEQGKADKTKRPLFAALNGRNELDQQTLERGAGDPDGRGGATVTIDGTMVCWGITVTNLDQPVAAHIHKAKRTRNGDIVVPLSQPATGDPGASSGCADTRDADLTQDIARHPRRYYVNVHTLAFPFGAVRGQLFHRRR